MEVLACESGQAHVLAEGSVYERLRRDPDVRFDPHLGTGALVLDERYREVIADVHRGYLRIALDATLQAPGDGNGGGNGPSTTVSLGHRCEVDGTLETGARGPRAATGGGGPRPAT